MSQPLTVGALRHLIAALPDSACIMPDWAPDCTPSNYEPAVEIRGIVVGSTNAPGNNTNLLALQTGLPTSAGLYLSIQVALVPLDDIGDDDDEDDD